MSVYFMRMGDGGPIKIGHAQNVAKRRTAFQIAVASTVEVLSVIDGGAETEAEVHRQFGHLRLRGELFRPDQELMAHIASLPPAAKRRAAKIATGGKRGRKKVWNRRLILPLSFEHLHGLDAVREEGEARLDVIREGIERELKAREKGAGKGEKSR
jgi:hypothetical protein